MWSPTHVQVTVCRAKGLLTKGKNGTNDCFVTISLGKEKFQTSVKLKSTPNLEWQEECELPIPIQGNTAEITLTALHQNFIGVDEFLGQVTLPLSQFDVYERPRTKWYQLKSKPGQEGKNKNRGEIEVRVAFTVKSGSLLDLSKKEKHKGSLGHITQAAHNIGGSLMNLGGKDKKAGIKKLASTVGSKLRLNKKGDDKDDRLSRHSSGRFSGKYSSGEPDPGVISEDDDEFRFDELSHKSSGSSLNLAGSSNQASGQGSLENLGGGEFVRHNSKRSIGSIPSRAVHQSSSSSNLAAVAAVNAAASKSPGGNSNDWGQKLFGGNKQSKSESVKKVVPEETTPVAAVVASSSSSSSSLSSGNVSGGNNVLSGVPSIIIQDSFVVEEPSLSPTHQPPVPKPRRDPSPNAAAAEVQAAPPPTKPRRMVTDEPAEPPQPAGEDADDAWPRMSGKPVPPSFPVASNDGAGLLTTAPVPKPRTSPLPPDSPPQPPAVLPRRMAVPETKSAKSPSQPPNPFEEDEETPPNPFEDSPPNPFDDSEDEEEEPARSTANETYATVRPVASAGRLEDVEEEEVLSEDSVCQMLERAIEDHDPIGQRAASPVGVLELYSEDATCTENTVDFTNDDAINSEETLDFFNNASAMEISPVEKAGQPAQAGGSGGNSSVTPVQEGQEGRRARGFFSTPRHVPETPMDHNVSVVRLEWMEASDDSGQGFGGSVEGQSGSSNGGQTATSAATKTLDSAIAVPDEEATDSPIDLEAAKTRRLSYFLPPHDVVFTPPTVEALPEATPAVSAVLATPTATMSTGKKDLSWDNYDMQLFPSPKLAPGRRSMVPEDPVPLAGLLSPLGEDEATRRKRISLAPCLKGLTLGTPFSDTTGSPFTEDEDEEEEEEEEEEKAELAGGNNETQRAKMASTFHQRVVVGEDKPVNNNAPKDHHSPRESPSTEDRQRLYQGRSREGLISLLEDRDKEIADLKEYIDSLLLRVIDACPTVLQSPPVVLQTPVKTKNALRK